jgi:hypothetical protein
VHAALLDRVPDDKVEETVTTLMVVGAGALVRCTRINISTLSTVDIRHSCSRHAMVVMDGAGQCMSGLELVWCVALSVLQAVLQA